MSQNNVEPDPVPTEAQKRVREEIAATIKKPEELKKVSEDNSKHQVLNTDVLPNPNTQPEAQHVTEGHVQDGLEPKKS